MSDGLMVLADGRKFDPVTKKVIDERKPRQETVVVKPIVNTQLRIEDLPGTPKQMNVICAILSYKVIGLRDSEIAFALGCTLDQLDALIGSDLYMQMNDLLQKSYTAAQQETARGLIAAKAIDAATKLVDTLDAEDETVSLRAAESILNRAGITEANQGNNGSGLVIKIVKPADAGDIKVTVEA